MKVMWITDKKELFSEELQQKWLEWMEHDPDGHVFSHPAMIRTWLETYYPLRQLELRVLLLETGDGILFWPLVKWLRNWKNGFQRLLIPIGYSDFDYCDPVCIGNRKELIREALEILGKSDDIDMISCPGFRNCYTDEMTEGEPCPYIDLQPYSHPEDFTASMKSKLRCNLHRRRKMLESDHGKTVYERLTEKNLSAILEELPSILEIHRKRWPFAYKAPHYHENLLRYGLKSGILHFSRLRTEKEVISWRIGFIYRKTFYSYMPVLNESYSRYSPGKLHLLCCIEDAIASGLERYDQMRGAELYKSEWTSSFRYIYNYKKSSEKILSRIRNSVSESLKPSLRAILHGS